MSDPRYSRDPFDQSQYRRRQQPEQPAEDPYGQEEWMLDPYAQGPDQPAADEQPFDWGGGYEQGQPSYDTGQQAPYGTPAPPAPRTPPGPPPAYQPGYETGGYDTGQQPPQDWADPYQSGQSGQYQPGDYQTGQYDTGAYQTGAYQAGDYETGAYQAGPYETGGYQTGAYQTGQYDTGQYDTGQYETGQYATGPVTGQLALPPGAPHEEAWPTAAEMRNPLQPMEPEPEAPPAAENPILRRVRRQRGHGFDATVLAAVVLIVVTGVALLANRPHPWTQPKLAADTSKPQSAVAMCPGKPRTANDTMAIADADDAGSGPVELTGAGAEKGKVDVSAGKLSTPRAKSGAVTIKAGPEVASGLVAGRSTTKPLAAVDCAPPQATAWIPGVGAGASHDSVLELTNPNTGSATVDVALFDDKGKVNVPEELRGIAIPGGATRTFDLLHVVPREGDLSLSTTVVRGQVGATIRDRHIDVESGDSAEDWFAGQSEPATVNRLIGFPKSGLERALTVANPGDDQVSVTIKLITSNAVIAPEGAPDMSVPPHGMAQVDLDKMLSGPAGEGAYGIEVTTSSPVTAAMRTVHNGDISVTTAAQAVTDRTALALPTGPSKKVYVAGEGDGGTVNVVAFSAAGKKLRSKDVEVSAHGGATIDLPSSAALVQLTPDKIAIHAAVLMSGNGDTVLPFRPLRTTARSAGVAPGLPLPLH